MSAIHSWRERSATNYCSTNYCSTRPGQASGFRHGRVMKSLPPSPNTVQVSDEHEPGGPVPSHIQVAPPASQEMREQHPHAMKNETITEDRSRTCS